MRPSTTSHLIKKRHSNNYRLDYKNSMWNKENNYNKSEILDKKDKKYEDFFD
jgi:hypothetical protein